MNINLNRTLRNKIIQTTEIQAIYAISLQTTRNTSHSYCALSPQPEVKPFLLLFGGPWLVVWVKSLGQVPRITPGMYNTLNWMQWFNAKIWITCVKGSPPYKGNSSSPWLAPWTFCVWHLPCKPPSFAPLWIFLLYCSGTQREGEMELGCMYHTWPKANLEPYCFQCYFFYNPYIERSGTPT